MANGEPVVGSLKGRPRDAFFFTEDPDAFEDAKHIQQLPFFGIRPSFFFIFRKLRMNPDKFPSI